MEDSAGKSGNRRQGERRRRRLNFVLHERRSGFDRRAVVPAGPAAAALGSVLVGLRERPATLRTLLAAVNLLNLTDFALTLNVLSVGGGEANPVMRSLFALGPIYAGIFKIIAVLLTTWLVWRFRRYRRALEAALFMVAVFAGVFFYHVIGLAIIG